MPGIVRKNVLRQLHGQGLGRLAVDQVDEQLEAHLAMLVTLFDEHPFAVGETLSAADLALFGPLQALRSPLTPGAQAAVNRHPTVVDWMRRVDQATSGPHTATVEG